MRNPIEELVLDNFDVAEVQEVCGRIVSILSLLSSGVSADFTGYGNQSHEFYLLIQAGWVEYYELSHDSHVPAHSYLGSPVRITKLGTTIQTYAIASSGDV